MNFYEIPGNGERFVIGIHELDLEVLRLAGVENRFYDAVDNEEPDKWDVFMSDLQPAEWYTAETLENIAARLAIYSSRTPNVLDEILDNVPLATAPDLYRDRLANGRAAKELAERLQLGYLRWITGIGESDYGPLKMAISRL